METQDPRLSPAIDDNEAAAHASLQLELRVPERQMIGAFREAFLRWLNDADGPFAQLGGRPEGLSLDEVPDGGDPQHRSLLRLSVRWSFASQPVTRVPTAPPTPAIALAETQSRPTPDQFVFFPDPPQGGAPLFHEVSIPLQRDHVPVRTLRVGAPFGATLRRTALRGVGAALGLARATPRRLGLARLTIRTPLAPGGSRVWSASLLGTAAVAVGFTAGTIYLATSPRAARLPELPAAVAVTAPAASFAAPKDAIPAPAVPLEASLPQIQPSTHPMEVLGAGASRQPLPTSSDLGIADAEVTTRRGPAAARQVAERSATPVVVRAAEVTDTSGGDRGRAKGALLVRSDPQGAEVSINGVAHGRTPLVIRDLGAGSRVVRLDLAGYERWSWAIAVVANRRTPVTVKLQPEARGAGQE